MSDIEEHKSNGYSHSRSRFNDEDSPVYPIFNRRYNNYPFSKYYILQNIARNCNNEY
jgi:hypothetical protein